MEYESAVVPLFRRPQAEIGEVPWLPVDPEADTQPIPAVLRPADPASVLAGPAALAARA